MKIIKSAFDNQVLLLKPKVYTDERGYFYESFKLEVFQQLSESTQNINFLQDNESLSGKNIVRGLHFQAPPFAQGKLVRVIKGSVYDVAVDIRKSSKTYGQYFGAVLSERNKYQMWVPPGFAHGFQTLEEDTIFAYKCSEDYHPEVEDGILWNDESININWPLTNPTLSAKDAIAKKLNELTSPFD